MGDVIIFRKPMPRWRELLFTAIGVPVEHWGTPLGEQIALDLVCRFAENESRETRH
jgi:hypothetical protein